ncbi:hypothetical protein NIES2119_03250 [[Phormidium ambiguum] IAM M-71]|uniref:Uncharacterized protein n=1 Tax=[Phormidium ambiguum] IAM M-71 TaxID=454136 RepID=A0A1U7IRA7_9CYAN|nr:hypothetical protein [Phormidium ambiguum]OKH39981.1 hypothetical protein NIES2119_03250 [Phormidium ambiguum IAM M-71]
MNSLTSLLDKSAISQWQAATWEDYLAACEDANLESARVFFYDGYLLIEMGNEGINHARFNSLLTLPSKSIINLSLRFTTTSGISN